MAEKRIKLEVIVTDNGTLKVVGKDLKSLNKEAKETAANFNSVSNAANKTKRNLDGTANRTNRAGKDFSRMSQGMGGLVQAYATVAANVYALSSAFLVLRRTADLSSMIKSAEDFSNRYGRSVTRITKQIQEATGGALSFAEALPTVNKAISAGVPTQKIEALAIAATKASQTFGGSANEALNRFISASQRGRVEIIQTLGVVIKTEKAYADYAASVGKTAQQLTAYDRQQAILNATIAESQSVFDGVNIDPNPFQQLLTTMVDLKDTIGIFITDRLTPMFNAFNKSKTAAAAFFAVIIGSIAGRIFPALSTQIADMQKRSFEATRNATRIMQQARNKQSRLILESGVKQNNLTKDELLKRSSLFNSYYQDRLSKHKTFGKSLLNQQKQVDAAILNERRSAITRELNARAKGKGSAAFRGISSVALENERNRLILLTKETNNARAAVQKLTAAETARNSILKRGAVGFNLFTTSISANITALKAQIGTGFQRSFAQTQQSFILGTKMMARSWANFVKVAVSQSKSGELAMAAFARAVGKSAGFIAGAFAKALSAFTTISFLISAGLFIWDKFGDKIRGITPEMRTLKTAQEELAESLKETADRTNEWIARVGTELPKNLLELKKAADFVAGTFDSISNTLVQYRKKLVEALGGRTVAEVERRYKELGETLKTLPQNLLTGEPSKDFSEFSNVGASNYIKAGKAAQKNRDEALALKKEFESLGKILDILNNEGLPSFTEAMRQGAEAAKVLGVNAKEIQVQKLTEAFEEFSGVQLPIPYRDIGFVLDTKTPEEFNSAISDLSKITGKSVAEVTEYLTRAGIVANNSLNSISSNTSAVILSFQDLDQSVSNYAKNFSRQLTEAGASSGSKEYASLIVSIINDTEELIKTAESGATSLEELFKKPGEAARIKGLLGFDPEEVVSPARLLKEAQLEQDKLINIGKRKLELDKQSKLIELEKQVISSDFAKSNLDILTRAIKLNDVEEKQLQNKIDITKNSLDAAEHEKTRLLRIVNMGELEKKRLVNIENELTVLKETEKTQETLLSILKRRNALEEELLAIKLANDEVASTKALLNLELQLSNLRIKTASTLAGSRGSSVVKDELAIKSKIYVQEIRTLLLANERLKREQELSSTASEVAEKNIKANDTQLKLLRETYLLELEINQLREESYQRQESGLGYLKEVATATLLLENMLSHAKRTFGNVPPVLETAAIGFNETIIGGFDTAIANLLEGGHDFGVTVREAMKATLREVFKDILMNQIKDSIGVMAKGLQDKLFPGRSAKVAAAEAEAKAQAERENQAAIENVARANAMAISTQTGITTNTAMAIETVIPDKLQKIIDILSTAPGAVGGATATPAVAAGGAPDFWKNGINNIAKGIEKQTNTPIQLADGQELATVGQSPSVEQGLNLVSSIVQSSSQDSKQAIVSILTSLVGIMQASATSSSGGGWASFFGSLFGGGGAANGAIFKGGITPFQDGGLVKSPTVGLVGEGRYNEAIVPLPNNREIPVELRGGGETININTEQHFDFTNANADTVAQLRSEAKMIEERTFNKVFAEINKGGRYARMVGRR